MNYAEQMRKLANDYYARRLSRDDFILARRQILLNMDVALNGKSVPSLSAGEDVTQPKFSDNIGYDPHGEDATKRND